MKDKKANNEHISLGFRRHIDKINVKKGELSFGQRIELGKILSTGDDDLIKSINTINCLHNFYPNYKQLIKLSSYINEIYEGILHWINAENTLLHYEPSSEEKRAGIIELIKKIGEFGTIKALAKAYNTDPDDVLNWKYAKVFAIIYTDLEESKFNKRHQSIIIKK